MTAQNGYRAIDRMLAAGDLSQAWTAWNRANLDPKTDRQAARQWLELARRTGGSTVYEVVQEVWSAWPADWELSIVGCSALIALAGSPIDMPYLREPIAARAAADRAAAALDELSSAQARNPDIGGLLWMQRANALSLCGPDHDAPSRAAFDRAMQCDRSRGDWWFDYGLFHKRRLRFAEALKCTREALRHEGPTRRVLWNVGICATGAGDGEEALSAWKTLGFDVSPSESGLPGMNGMPPIRTRIPTRGTGHAVDAYCEGADLDRAVTFELLWVAPVSPCHGVVQTPSFRDAPVDYGDLVLWDGTPVRAEQGSHAPCFPCLGVLRKGTERRMHMLSYLPPGHSTSDLEHVFPHNVQVFFATSRPSDSTPPAPSEGRLVRAKLIAPERVDLAAVRTHVEQCKTIPIAVPRLYELLGDSRRAGQEHQAWRALERRWLPAATPPPVGRPPQRT